MNKKQREVIAELDEQKKKLNFSRIIMGLFMILIIITMVIPFYAIKLDPAPKNIPSLEELNLNITFSNQNHKISSRNDYLNFLNPEDPLIKQLSAKISTQSCDDIGRANKICYAKALFYFVRDEIQYINDPVTEEYLEYPTDTLYSGSADCDGKSILLANMLQSIGIETRFVFVPGHVFVQAYLPEALNRHKEQKSDAINLDAACMNCDFGKLSREVRDSERTYLE